MLGPGVHLHCFGSVQLRSGAQRAWARGREVMGWLSTCPSPSPGEQELDRGPLQGEPAVTWLPPFCVFLPPRPHSCTSGLPGRRAPSWSLSLPPLLLSLCISLFSLVLNLQSPGPCYQGPQIPESLTGPLPPQLPLPRPQERNLSVFFS